MSTEQLKICETCDKAVSRLIDYRCINGTMWWHICEDCEIKYDEEREALENSEEEYCVFCDKPFNHPTKRNEECCDCVYEDDGTIYTLDEWSQLCAKK